MKRSLFQPKHLSKNKGRLFFCWTFLVCGQGLWAASFDPMIQTSPSSSSESTNPCPSSLEKPQPQPSKFHPNPIRTIYLTKEQGQKAVVPPSGHAKEQKWQPDPMTQALVVSPQGQPLPLHSLFDRNRPTLLVVWASFCGPCIKEMPSLHAVNEKKRDQVNIILVCLDDKRDEENYKSLGVTMPVYMATNQFVENFNVTSIPQAFLFSKDGQCIKNQMGALDWSGKEGFEFLKDVLHPASPKPSQPPAHLEKPSANLSNKAKKAPHPLTGARISGTLKENDLRSLPQSQSAQPTIPALQNLKKT